MECSDPCISVIICCYNSGARIKSTLAALAAQKLPPDLRVEVVLVDNASTDGTPELASSSWRRDDMPLRIVTEARQGLSFARHAGLCMANSPVVCFVDDDNFLAPDYLKVALEIMAKHPQAAACGGCGVPEADGEIPGWMWRGWRSHAVGPQGDAEGYVPDSRGFVYGAGMVLRKSALDQLDAVAFRSMLTDRQGESLSSGGDVELCLALRMLGWKLAYSPRLQFKHLMPGARLRWDYCLKLFYSYGQANAVLSFYSAWIGPATWGRWLKRTSLGTLAWCLRIQARAARLRKQSVAAEPSAAALYQQELLGRADALLKLRQEGQLRVIHRGLRQLYARCCALQSRTN